VVLFRGTTTVVNIIQRIVRIINASHLYLLHNVVSTHRGIYISWYLHTVVSSYQPTYSCTVKSAVYGVDHSTEGSEA
jgi:hypothetical protein